ncbi:MAG: hypothetical protein CO129_06180 [Ignavibacteriales bacterium CG_4_9_14_3_um_filter_34_10]|nr:MAG: hypothetical protein CO129_06180 [Ignavibacteriales bacterium CG_4_9_14_3_um_filter_34_10]
MRLKNSLLAGFRKMASVIKLVLVMYSVTFVFSFVLGSAFSMSMSSFKSKPLLSELFAGFDYTVFSDFMHNYGDSISPIFNVMIMFAVFYLLMEIIFAGGLIGRFHFESNKMKAVKFFGFGIKYFWRYTRLFLYKLLALAITFGIVITIASVFFDSFDAGIETDYIKVIIISAVIFLILFLLLSVISDYAKIIIVKTNLTSSWTAIKMAVGFVFTRIHVVALIFLAGIVIYTMFTIIYLTIAVNFPITNMFSVFVLFVLQQLFIFLRFITKTFVLASEFSFHVNETVNLKKKILKGS